ncbi:MAG TPA: selenocysteine-specific translation elongation factor [Acidobacteriota bacterium]
MRSVVIGTAGHIDHGKSELVRALTGIDPDRLKEEKERGITIDLGYAHRRVGALQLAFVDVPGHERFVKNMLAGAGGIDLVLLVVAADESVKPQTLEHFEICRLLDLRGGVIALSKVDLVDRELRDLVELELRDLVRGSFLEGAPIVATSARSGEGLEALVGALEQAAAALPARSGDGPFRLPIDRAFTMKGFGTVVTGTVASGALSIGEPVELLPGGARGVARSLQAHGEPVERIRAGQRAALNLSGVEVGQAGRGELVSRPGRLTAWDVLDLEVELLAEARPLPRRTRVRLHHQAAEVLARLYPLTGAQLEAGSRGWVRAHLERPLVALPGDRVILRSYSPMRTIGGGRVIESAPPRRLAGGRQVERLARLAGGDPSEMVEALVEAAGGRGLAVPELIQRTGWSADRVEQSAAAAPRLLRSAAAAAHLFTLAAVERIEQRVIEALEQFHAGEPLKPGMALEALRARCLKGASETALELALSRLTATGRLKLSGSSAALAGFRVELDPQAASQREALLSRLRQAGAQGLSGAELLEGIAPRQGGALLQLLLQRGEVVRAGELHFDPEAIEALRRGLRELARERPQIAVADLKALGGISRRSAIPLLEYFDREGFTRRVGDLRVLTEDGQ